MLYREGMSGLVLLAAVCAVVIFVVTVKYTGTLILGVPSGVFFVLTMTMVVTVCMLAVYVRDMIGARNLFIWYAATVAELSSHRPPDLKCRDSTCSSARLPQDASISHF